MNLIKGIARALIRMMAEIVHRVFFNIWDTIFGFINWPQKKLRIKILLLQDQQIPGLRIDELDLAINNAKNIFKQKFNVILLPVTNDQQYAEVSDIVAPVYVLYTKGGQGALIEEFKNAGNFFAQNLTAPIYTVTVFIVTDIKGATGCSLGPLTDYITLDNEGARDATILAHELAHACGLWHLDDKTNLLWNKRDRGDKIRWWQKNIFRGSRHVTYW